MSTPSLLSNIPPDLPSFLLTSTLIILLPSTILITTSPTSPLRYITIPILAYLASLFITPYHGASSLRVTATAQLVLITVQATHLLLIARLDDRTIAREIPERAFFKSDRLYRAAELLIQPRGVGTPRVIKNVPEHPGYYNTSAKLKRGDKDKGSNSKATAIPKSKFLIRQIAIFTWQYLALDVLQTVARQQAFEGGGGGSASGFTRIDWFVSPEKWLERGLTNLITWFVTSRIVIDVNYRFVSIVFVGAGLDTPENWPPAFGRMRDVYTIRNFWG